MSKDWIDQFDRDILDMAKSMESCDDIYENIADASEKCERAESADWQAVLDTLPPPILKLLVKSVAQWNNALREKICSYQDLDADDPMAMHVAAIEDLCLPYENRYYLDEKLVKALMDYVQEQVTKHMQEGNRACAIRLVVLLCKEVFTKNKFVEPPICRACVTFCTEYLQQILQQATEAEMQLAYTQFLPLLDIDRREIELEDVVVAQPWSADILTRYCTWLDEHMTAYRLHERLLIMYRLGQTPEEFVTYLQSYDKPYFRQALREWYIEYDPATAIPLLQEELAKATDPLDICLYSEQLADVYKNLGDRDSEREWLLYLVLEQQDNRFLSRLKELLEPEIWRDVFVQAVKKTEFESERYQMLADEKMYDLLLMEIMDTKNLDLFLHYEKALSKQYPEQTYEILKNLLQETMAAADNRAMYKWVVSKLKRVKKYPQGKERLQALVDGFYVQYSQRRALKEELAKAGYVFHGEI